MPVEIRELTIKATLALDWENQTVSENKENIVCLILPTGEDIIAFVKRYFKKHKAQTVSFDQAKLSTFLVISQIRKEFPIFTG